MSPSSPRPLASAAIGPAGPAPSISGGDSGEGRTPAAAVSALEGEGQVAAPAAPAADAEAPRWLHALRGWRGALLVYVAQRDDVDAVHARHRHEIAPTLAPHPDVGHIQSLIG